MLGVDILIVLVLILINGVFSMSEIAVISARKARLLQRVEEGDEKARVALDLANEPNMLLSTVQIGITLVGVLSGAFGGVTLAREFAHFFNRFGFIYPYGESVSLGVVVLCITYLSLVIGELVPKRIALNHPENIAVRVGGGMRFLAAIAAPAVHLLSVSTNLVLRIMRFKTSEEPPVTEEEIKILIEQGTAAGVFHEAEQEMMSRILRLGDRRVGALMTPRKRIDWLDVNDSAEKNRRKITRSVRSRFPVCQGRLSNVLGVVHVKDLLTRCLSGRTLDIRSGLQQPLFVLESTHALRVMELFKESGTQVGLVVDEYGTIEGLVTLTDILESIIGDIPSLDETGEPPIVQREDGSWLVDGMVPVDEVREFLEVARFPDEEAGDYETLGGFVMNVLKRVPGTGDRFECCGFQFEVVDMDGHRVDKVLISRLVDSDRTK
ncbi:MAG: hemolysin family protein [Syntrophobacteraceae bacterium]|jgi:putative hemolysin|nr:hemolysin family protein [Syntrophobacteraceae bacterium]